MWKKFILLISWLLVCGFVVLKVLFTTLPYNPLSPGQSEKLSFMSVLPQGWGFFTRNPREADLYLFKYTSNNWQINNHMPISSYRNSFGMNRLPRAESVELAMFMTQIPDSVWKEDTMNIHSFNVDTTNGLAVINTSPYPVLIGKFCVAQQEPVPWAWSWNRKNLKMPAKYVVINVTKAE